MAVLLGRTSAATTADSQLDGWTAIWKFTASASGTLVVLKGQTKQANASLSAMKLGIYLDVDGTAASATLMTTQAVDSLAAAQGTGIFIATLASPQSITSGLVYWLGWRGVGETLDWQGDPAGSYNEKNADFLDPFGGGSSVGTTNAIIWGEDAGAASSVAWYVG
jgi:hypothetical protein